MAPLAHLLLVSISLCFAVCFAYPTTITQITLDQLLQVAPKSTTCVGAPFPSECRTAAQALVPIADSLSTYGVSSSGEVAALISLMAYETADFEYQNNHYPAPGNPGQGTRNMQSAMYNLQYAKSIPSLASPLATILGSNGATTAASMTAEQLNNVRALLTSNDAYDFASAAWFLTAQCSSEVRAGLQSGSLAGWQAYLTDCIGTTATSDRQAIWSIAIKVFDTTPSRRRW